MDIEARTAPAFRIPLAESWPEDELEHLGRCPVCGSQEREVAFSGLQDRVFFCAPGSWTLWRCATCRVGYLDPRPNPASIGRAYQSYYTHSASRDSKAPPGMMQLLRRGIAHSFLNHRFGHRLTPAIPFGWLAMSVMRARARTTCYHYRHLPAPRDPSDRLLDVGCGNGHFLRIARDDLHYNVEGLEIDPRAVEVAAGLGLKVHEGTLPGSNLAANGYYQITISHVLEHLHDPVAAVQEMFQLLKPGGRLWVCVPNLAASSLARFGTNSRLLEPPRHLVMFDSQCLRSLLETAGFHNVRLLPDFMGTCFVHQQSWMIEKGMDPYATDVGVIPYKQRFPEHRPIGSDEVGTVDGEFITMIGTKPDV